MGKFNAEFQSGCKEWRDAISVMVDGGLSPSEHQKVWQHLQTCHDCRQYYRQLQAIKKRVQRTNWASLWAKAVRENRKLRRLVVVGTLLAALASASITFAVVRRFVNSPQMTPTAAIGIFRYHMQVPPEWTFNPCCQSGAKCMTERAGVSPVTLSAPKNAFTWERAGICECLGKPLSIYYASVNGNTVALLHFNMTMLPLKAETGSLVQWHGKDLRCCIVDNVHLLLWQEEKDGFALLVPFGKVNPLQIIPHIRVVARGQKVP